MVVHVLEMKNSQSVVLPVKISLEAQHHIVCKRAPLVTHNTFRISYGQDCHATQDSYMF